MLIYILVSLCLLLLIGIGLAYRFHPIFVSPVLRIGFIVLGYKSGVWISFKSARGNLLKKQFTLQQLKLEYKITNHLNITAESCQLEFHLSQLFFDLSRVVSFKLKGLHLDYERHTLRKNHKSLPPFVIQHIHIDQGTVIFKDFVRKVPSTLTLELNSYTCEGLESQWLIFDLVFHSTIEGEVENAPFSVEFLQSEDGQQTSFWNVASLPVHVVAPYVDGKLDFISESKMDLRLKNDWNLNESNQVNMACHLVLKEVLTSNIPTNLPLPAQILTDSLTILMNNKVQEIPVSFEFNVKKDDFLDLMAIDTIGLFNAFSEALNKALAEKTSRGLKHMQDIGQFGMGILNDLRDLFDLS